VSIWLRLGGDDIKTASPKAIPSVSLPLIRVLSARLYERIHFRWYRQL
jgi:hypothetical protein